MATFTWNTFGALMDRLGQIAHPDPTPMLQEWEQIILDDNRRGVLAGLDCNDVPMPKTTYRPKPPGPQKWTKKKEAAHASRRGVFAGLGPFAAGFDDNLTPAQYRLLGGPPLAPRGDNSRVIKSLETGNDWNPETGEGLAYGAWADVVSKKGVPFLCSHFEGLATGGWFKGALPRRDLRGVRAWGRTRALRAMREWGAKVLKAIG